MVGLNSLAASWELAALIYEAKQCRLNTQGLAGFCLSHLTLTASRRGGDLGKRVHPPWKGWLPVSALGYAHKPASCHQFVVLKLARNQLDVFIAAPWWMVWLIPGPRCGRPGWLGICQVLPVLLCKELKKTHHTFVTKINSGVSTALP